MPERNAPAIMQKNANLTWKKQPLYDTFITAAAGAGVPVVTFFQVPIGGIGSGFAVAKTNNETNMNSAGKLGKPNQFLLEGFQINVVMPPVGAVNLCDADFQAVYNSGLFRFIRGTNKVELEIPLDRIPTGPGPDGFATTATAGVPLGVAFAFDAINSERTDGTLPRLLSQPIYRDDVVNGKFVAGLAVITVVLVAVVVGASMLGLRRFTGNLPATS